MPLRDHFRPPLSQRTSWEGLHGQWPAVIVQQLGKLLPAQYVAEPRVHSGSQVEIDVAAFDQEGGATSYAEADRGGVAAAVWAPAEPTLAVETELSDFDEYEVRVYDVRHGRRLVAAIEIISPANKDRPENRGQFVAKCAALLRQRVSVVLIDLVTVRDFNLYAQLLQWIGEQDQTLGDAPPAVYAVTCCWRPRGGSRWLETWNRPLAPGRPLPVLPLWLTDEEIELALAQLADMLGTETDERKHSSRTAQSSQKRETPQGKPVASEGQCCRSVHLRELWSDPGETCF